MDSLIQPRVSGLHAGVSRQPPLLRNPAQMEDVVNFYPSVDAGGLIRRPPSKLIASMVRADYRAAGAHFFKTTDGQQWVLIRRAEVGQYEVRRLSDGTVATLAIDALTLGYLQAGADTDFRYLTIADTTLILNRSVVVAQTEQAVPPLTAVYVEIIRTTSASQAFYFYCPGYGTAAVNSAQNNVTTRDAVADALARQIALNIPGLSAYTLGNAPNVVKVTGPEAQLKLVSTMNSWDATAMTCIKGKVDAASKLPPVFEDGVVIKIDETSGDGKTAYYVRFDQASGSYIESSYLALGLPTLRLAPNTLPLLLKQTGTLAFSIGLATWAQRTKGDSISNRSPFFVGKRITDLAVWNGRLLFASEDTLVGSQPDDLFNFWKETARESRASDPIELPATTGDVTVINHVIEFNRNLMATSDNVQLQVPGDKAFTNESASIGIATRYNLDKNCRPAVVGDALFYAGTAEGRSALWEYAYDYQGASNTAFDLSKHVPGYVPGRVAKIAGVPQSGRLFLWSASNGPSFYTHTTYFNGADREQNAWSRVLLGGVSNVMDFAVQDDKLYALVEQGNRMALISLQADAQGDAPLPGLPLPLPYMDLLVPCAPQWDVVTGKSSFTLPAYMAGMTVIVCAASAGDEWWTEWATTVVSNTVFIRADPTGKACFVGVRMPWSLTFSKFFAISGQSYTSAGRMQVHRVSLDFATVGDYTATIARPDRGTATAQRSARVIDGDSIRPILAHNVTTFLPFNAKSDVPTLTLSADNTAPCVLTGYTLFGRYTNPFTN